MPETDKHNEIVSELTLLRDAAREAGRIAMRYFGRSPEVWLKDGSSPVSEADLAVDRYLKDVLLKARPDYGWISEETVDERAAEKRSRAFVVDPIDGTRAYIAGQDQWCISIAVVENGRPLAGVLECPARNELIEAGKGVGASQNGAVIRVRLPLPGEQVTIASARNMVTALPESWRDRAKIHPYVPSLAYRIAMVARGDIAGTFIRPNSHDWDLAA
ncbi:MAG TPA: 3'(2'),5'-bisphosphate nucleotidase CysQ, partial [Ochrobactrum anthropi]|nr:3'(2'),5'-bisphosphate nucleotidase CysQ [Brucella anthropi]